MCVGGCFGGAWLGLVGGGRIEKLGGCLLDPDRERASDFGLEGFSGSECEASLGSVGGNAPGSVRPGLIGGSRRDRTKRVFGSRWWEAWSNLIGGSSSDPLAGVNADWGGGLERCGGRLCQT